jgi:hypothetical protein
MTYYFQRAAVGENAVIMFYRMDLRGWEEKQPGCLVMPNGISIRYQESIYVCI